MYAEARTELQFLNRMHHDLENSKPQTASQDEIIYSTIETQKPDPRFVNDIEGVESKRNI